MGGRLQVNDSFEEWCDDLEQEIAEARNKFLESLKNPDWTNKKPVLLNPNTVLNQRIPNVYGQTSVSTLSLKPGEKWIVDSVNDVRWLR